MSETYRYLVESNVQLDLLSMSGNTPIIMPSAYGSVDEAGKELTGPTNVNPGTAVINMRRIHDE